MDAISEMRDYIEKTRIAPKKARSYCLCLDDLAALCDMAAVDPLGAFMLAFAYGQAKGCRMGRSGR